MNPAQKAMALGLRALNRFAGMSLIDRLKLRTPSEQVIYQAARAGFSTASAVARGVKATGDLLRPARLPRAEAGDLFDLNPSDEQQLLREAVGDFSREQLRPGASAADADCAAPAALLKQCAELGIGQLGIPEELGGAGT